MSKPKVVFDKDDFEFVLSQAKIFWIDSNPDCQIPGTTVRLNDKYLIALSYIKAVSSLLNRKNCGTNFDVSLEEAGPEPDTEVDN